MVYHPSRPSTLDLMNAAGADFFGQASALQDDLFTLSDTAVLKVENSGLEQFFLNTKVVEPIDFDKDGDMDLFVGNQHNTGQFGIAPQSYILENTSGSSNPSLSILRVPLQMPFGMISMQMRN